MATSLFQTKQEPTVETVDVTEVPAPGPNAHEVMAVQYDPDQALVVVSLPNDVQAAFHLGGMDVEGSGFTTYLEDTKLGPRIEIKVVPRTPLPKFSSPEEADAWLEANTR